MQTQLSQENHSRMSDPYLRFLYAIRSPQTKKKYPERFRAYLDFAQIPGADIQSRLNILFVKASTDLKWFQDTLMSFIEYEKDRVIKGEIVASTIANYYKPIKLFCDMNDIVVNWRLIARGIPKGKHASDDRVPTIQEIRKLLEYPDIRIKSIVTFLLSSGARIGAWDFLKWKHITPIKDKDDKILAAKVIIYHGEPEMYTTFVTPECYKILADWMDYRSSYGERISGESWVMRDLWRTTNLNSGSRRGSARNPKKLKNEAIRSILCRALKHQNIRGDLRDGSKRHDFKSAHGFRKFFRTRGENILKTSNMSLLMGYDLGLTSSYYKPTENELLEDYLKIVDLLTVSTENFLTKKLNVLEKKATRTNILLCKN